MIKLNLGCGNKIYPSAEGWVNVDVVRPDDVKIGTNVFVESDLKKLDVFPDNYAHEAHAYHVIEHFFRQDVKDILKEWLRVLKPDGIIVLEQPDIVKCAMNIITGILEKDPLRVNKLGILGIFGDGDEKNPYMSHRWGWFPDTLAQALIEAGFVDVQQTPAQTHMKDFRDFRLVARKPKECLQLPNPDT